MTNLKLEIFMIRIFFLLLAISCAGPQTEKIANIYGVGHDGKKISVNTSEKKGTVLTFLSVRCPCSNSNAGHLKELIKKYPDFNFMVIHGNMNEPLERSKKYFKKLAINAPVLYDKDSFWTKKLDAQKTPHTFIIDQQGKLVYQGAVTDSTRVERAKRFYLKDALQAMQEGKRPPEAATETLGCYIVRADEV
jgi:peroxiredoxin